MDLELADNVAVVVGGANGIGLAIARAFLAEGARVAILDRAANTAAVASDLQSLFGRGVSGRIVDVTQYQTLQAAAPEVLAKFGRYDHLVYAAGAGSGKFGFPFWNLEPSDWPRMLEVNLVGAVNMAHAFTPHLVESRRGTLLFISSVAGQIGSQTDPPYSAAKAGLINFMQCAAKDLAPHNVRANAICPGMIQTSLNRSVWDAWNARQPREQQQSYEAWGEEKVRRMIPLGRWQESDDVAQMAVFLASARAKNITGQTLNVDGGWVMHA
jgi:NAD(P)-dependent dehydrogenase (short-subunit alcohol dehydrogenase family)